MTKRALHFTLFLMYLTLPLTATSQAVDIPDPNLRAAIEQALGIAPGGAITAGQMATLTYLEAGNSNISNLTGVAGLTNLTGLRLSGNFSDISPVAGLTNLTTLGLGGNFSDISPVAGLTNLTWLFLEGTNISDISPVAGLTNLTNLEFYVTNISDISAVAGLTNLIYLRLNGNNIEDLSPLIANTGLGGGDSIYADLNPLNAESIDTHIPALRSRGVEVYAENLLTVPQVPSQVVDIPDPNLRVAIEQALGIASGGAITAGQMARLTNLDAGNSNISNLTGIEYAINLLGLALHGNDITEISAVGKLTKLTTLGLQYNAISDISAVAGLTNLNGLGIADNNIKDLSPLVANTGLGGGDSIYVDRNPLNAESIDTHIPALRSRGVEVSAEDLLSAVPSQAVDIPDPNLRAAIESALGIAPGGTITAGQMATLTQIEAFGSDISNLTGLEYATNLKYLNLGGNNISDISPVAGLTNLTILGLGGNNISDISPVAGLTNLTGLEFGGNNISDISAAAGLINLTSLGLYGDGISDISAVAGLTNLTHLRLESTNISDISLVAGLTNLIHLNLDGNNISDISPVAGLTSLTWLVLERNNISDISPVAGLTNLTHLALRDNVISDISPVTGLTNLTWLVFVNNAIEDLSPLVANTGLGEGDEIYVDRNPLNAVSINTHIPALRSRGVRVEAENLISAVPSQVVAIPDPNLRAAIESALGITPGGTITARQMAKLTALQANQSNISNLTGLEYATNVNHLDFSRNNISDLSPVEGLTNLTWLYLGDNNISDISAVANLTLDYLMLGGNAITDISAVAGLTMLTRLFLESNAIEDLSPLVANTGLGEGDRINLSSNPINAVSINTHIAALESRGVEVEFDNRTPRSIRIVSGDDQQGMPDAALAHPFVVEIQDQNGAAFEGVPVTFTIASGGGALSVTSATTDANGRAESTLTLGPNPGANTVTVSVSGIQENQTFTAQGIRIPTTLAIISGGGQEGLPGSALENPFVVEVQDQSDKPLPGVPVSFSVTAGGGTLSATSATTDANGRAESALTLGANPGANTVTVSVSGIQENQTFTAQGIRIPETLEIISGNDQEGPYGETLENSFIVEVRDQFDEPLPGVQVTFSVTAGDGTLSATSVATDSNGRAGSILTLGPDPGTNSVDVTVAGITRTETFTAEGIRTPLAFWIITGFDQTGYIGEALPRPIVIEVRDRAGERLPGVEVTFSVASGGGSLSVTSAITDTDGQAETVLTLGPDPGTNSVEVTVAGLPRSQTAMAFAELPPDPEDVNRDDVVNILDLVGVASALGAKGADLAADVNGDGIVNILDLVMVAGALGNAAAAPSADPRALTSLTATDVGQWLTQTRTLDLTDAISQHGVLFLERLLAALTPKETALLPNYPNPFNPETWIPYHLASDAEVQLTIYDARGALVRRLALGHRGAGYYTDRSRAAYWDGRNQRGDSVSSGVYFYRLWTEHFSAVRKMVIVK